jgi:D-aminopeptidase
MSTTPVRARDLGIAPGIHTPGPHNAITDVPGVLVGQTTIDKGTRFHTGVTAIVPADLDARKTLPAGLFVGNGYGKLIGATQLAELGEIETPILLTGTLSAFRAADALVTYMLGRLGNEEMRSVNPVVGETNDGYLSDIRARPITERHVLGALRGAREGPVDEGCAGAGAGTSALGFKAGIGTASRRLSLGKGVAPSMEHSEPSPTSEYTVGVIVQANFSGTLTVLGVLIDAAEALRETSHEEESSEEPGGNSCMIVIATDALLDSRQLDRVARRAVFGMARVGSDFSHGSGDYAIAFSTGEGTGILDRNLDPLFTATMECVEEAILNALFMAETTYGPNNHVRYAVPHGYVVERLREQGIIS